MLVANTPMDTDKIKMSGARVKIDSLAKVADIEAAERTKMKTKCEQIIAQGINVFINRQLIYNYPEQIFTDAGVMSIEHAGAPPSATGDVDCTVCASTLQPSPHRHMLPLHTSSLSELLVAQAYNSHVV